MKMFRNVEHRKQLLQLLAVFLTVLFRTIHSASHWVMLFMEFFFVTASV